MSNRGTVEVGASVYVREAGTFKRGLVRYIKGAYAGVKVAGERGTHEWPLAALVAS